MAPGGERLFDIGEIALPAIRKDRDDGLSRILRPGREPQRDIERSARGHAGKDALLPCDRARSIQGGLGGDGKRLVHQAGMEIRGQAGAIDIGDLVHAFDARSIRALGRRQRLVGGLGNHDAQPWVLLLQIACRARDRSARPDGADEDIDIAAGILPDLGARRRVMRLRVRRIGALVCEIGIGIFADDALQDRIDGVLHEEFLVVDQHDLGPVELQQVDLVLADRAAQIELGSIAARCGDRGQPDARIPAGDVDKFVAGLELPRPLRGRDDAERRPVLYAAGRIEELDLGEDTHVEVPVADDVPQLDQRRPADQRRQTLMNVRRGAPLDYRGTGARNGHGALIGNLRDCQS